MPSTKVVVNLPGKPAYDVRIGSGLVSGLGQRIAQTLPRATSAVIVSDSNVAPLYLDTVRASLEEAGFASRGPVADIVMAAGEESKSTACLAEIWDALSQIGLDRDGVIVALGGGVVGDIAGFAAATFLRGIHLVQVPTSLLAMVDSSVGGKTAVNLEAGKNLVGAFKQPAYVCIDTDVLTTLPDREWASGCAEIAKSAVLDSDDFFFWLRERAAELANHEADVVREAVARSVVFKANVVAADEEERTGVRAQLNYGHTLGHAIEVLAGYGTYSHGAAVAEGMRFAARLGAAIADAPLELVQEQDALLDDLGLPALDFAAEPSALLAAMKSDKKAHAGTVRFVLPADVGAAQVVDVDDDTLLEHLCAWAGSKE